MGLGDSGWRPGGRGERDPRGRLVSVGSVGGCTSPGLDATNRCLRNEDRGEVRRPHGRRAPGSCLRGRRVSESTCIASPLARAVGISVASRSAAPPTRLETRTKESNMCASHWAN